LTFWHVGNTIFPVKTLTIKLPDELFAEITRAAEMRKVPKSVVVRERLQAKSMPPGDARTSLWDRMEDLVITDDALPKDLSANKKHLKGYGQNRSD
jgi:lipopolysaccharide biosynthesis protein